MPVIPRISSLWRNLVHRRRVERDLDDELRAAVAILTEEKARAGLTAGDARRAAAIEMGTIDSLKARVRDVRSGALVDTLWQDLRYAVRSLRRTPGFTLVAVVTLALGIGANAAIFALLDAVILKPLPVPAPDELVMLYERDPRGGADAIGGTGRYLRFSFPRYRRLEQALTPDGRLAATTRSARFILRLADGAEPTPVRGQLVSDRHFDTLGVLPVRGRALTADDERFGAAQPVAVVSHGFWTRTLGARDDAIGRQIVLNDVRVTIVGVMPPGFAGLWSDAAADVWLPVSLQAAMRYDTNSSAYANADRGRPWLDQDHIAWLNVFGRVSAGKRLEAEARLQAANRQGLVELVQAFRIGRDEMLAHSLAVEPLARGFSTLRARYAGAIVALAGMVGLVLIVTCANVANLLLTRAAGRTRDVGIRLSLGATTGRLVRHYGFESLLLALAGGAGGLVAGVWTSGVLARHVLDTSVLPPVFTPDWRVLTVTAAVSLLTAVLFGVLPAYQAIRAGRPAALVTGQRGAAGGGALARMRPFVMAQLALAVVVVVGATLLGRTLMHMVSVDPGFAVDRLVTVSFDPDGSGYTGDQIPALEQRLIAAVHAVPGVLSAATSTCGLLLDCTYGSGFSVEGGAEGVSLATNWVGPGYFATVGIPVLAGREFDERDTAGRPLAVAISESVARQPFPEGHPIGRHLGFVRPDAEIVGVVADARTQTLHAPPGPMVYFPVDQPPATFRVSPRDLDVRVSGDPRQAIPAIREAVRRSEPGLVVDRVEAMDARVSGDVRRERVVAYLAASFAALALFLASLGLYGVLSYTVTSRTQEIGIRMSLGARSQEIGRLVMRDAWRMVAVGVLAGLGAALATGRLLDALLVGVTASDPFTYAIVLATLALSTLVAAYLPARRATRVDPLQALRGD